MTYRSVTISTTSDKNLDSMGYKVYVPIEVSGSNLTAAVDLDEKYSPHFKSEEEARKYIDYCKDANASADAAATFSNTITSDTE